LNKLNKKKRNPCITAKEERLKTFNKPGKKAQILFLLKKEPADEPSINTFVVHTIIIKTCNLNN